MELRIDLPTGSGMHGVWDRHAFAHVTDYDSWEAELLDDEDIERHVAAGRFVPINIRSDGTFAFTVRADAAATPSLTDDEVQRVVVSSEPYRFRSSGHLDVSGLEYVSAGTDVEEVGTLPLPPGDYEIRVHLMDYDDVEEKGPDEPDFIVIVGPPTGAAFRVSVQTFPPPSRPEPSQPDAGPDLLA